MQALTNKNVNMNNTPYTVYIYLKDDKEFITPSKGIAELRGDTNTDIYMLRDGAKLLLTYDEE
tara:strand:- start:614 stop:802 length:189 start_codon:yes stop_codon:yes gene_type:complete